MFQNCVNCCDLYEDGRYIKVWDQIDTDRKLEFIRSLRALNPCMPLHELTPLMAQFFSNELSSMLTTFAGLFLDLPDLKSKYKDKPEELEAVRAHTNKFVRIVNGWNLCEADEIRTKKRMMDCSPEEAPKATVASGGRGGQATVAPCAGAGNITKIKETQDTRNHLILNTGWSLQYSCGHRIYGLSLEALPKPRECGESGKAAKKK